jgi:large subunit ribosomal protein L28
LLIGLSTFPERLYLVFPKSTEDSSKKVIVMPLQCDVCGKKPSLGHQIARRGKAKYLGGVGRKITGISRRRFNPNLQRIQVEINGTVKRMRVCVQCIRSGRVKRPTKRKPFQMPNL